MTVLCWAARRELALPEPEARLFQVTPDTQVLAHCYWQPERDEAPDAARAARPRGIERRALHARPGRQGAEGRLQRRAPEPAQLRRHREPRSGSLSLRADRRRGVRHPGARADGWPRSRRGRGLFARRQSRAASGGHALAADLPSLKAVCAVSPVLELEACVRALERGSNFAYQWNFVRNLKARMRRKNACFPGRFDLSRLDRIRTVRQFDAAYTAPFFGFASAEDYYHRAAALRVVEHIRIPALVITAEDDPFVPVASVPRSEADRQPEHHRRRDQTRRPLRLSRRADGPDDDGYWAEAPSSSSRATSAMANANAECQIPNAEASCFANSGPFPGSSCLKYTKRSVGPFNPRITDAHRCISAA